MVTSGLSSDTHLERRLLHGDLTEDSGAVVRTNRPQLLLVEREELSASEHAEAGDGAAHTYTHFIYMTRFEA